MFDTQPIAYMSCGPGSSLAADFCATSRIDLPASIAASSALMDFGRPTNSGITMCGNTTTSRNGKSGSTRESAENVEVMGLSWVGLSETWGLPSELTSPRRADAWWQGLYCWPLATLG